MTYTFQISALKFENFLKSVPWHRIVRAPCNSKYFGVVVSPWCSCPVPWFSITVGLFLLARGARVRFVINDLTDSLARNEFTEDLKIINQLASNLPQLEWARLSDQIPMELSEEESSALRRRAAQTAIWWNRSALPQKSYEEARQFFESVYEFNAPYIKALLHTFEFDQLWSPGGMFGNSGVLSYLAASQGTTFSSYDSDYQFVIAAIDGVACHFPDIALAMKLAPSYLSPQELKLMEDEAFKLILQRANKSDRYIKTHSQDNGAPIQVVDMESNADHERWDVVIPLNVEWDSTALGMHKAFDNDPDWLLQTVRFILAETESSVAVRQHPVERINERDRISEIGKTLKSVFGRNKRFRFIECDVPISTYSLVSKAKLILPCSSTIGLECAALGKKVVLESRAYYADTVVRSTANTKDEYFQLIRSALSNNEAIDESERRAALRCFFLAVRASQLYGLFNPHPGPFLEWASLSFEQLSRDPSVMTLIEALTNNIPIGLLTAPAILGRSHEITQHFA